MESVNYFDFKNMFQAVRVFFGFNMIYTQATILESLRLGTPAPMSARTCTKECELGGLTIKEVYTNSGTAVSDQGFTVSHKISFYIFRAL